MRIAAHHMVRNLTAGMAMITCREPLLTSISNMFKSACISALKVSPSNSQGKKNASGEPYFVIVLYYFSSLADH